jgi:hypothetical protein
VTRRDSEAIAEWDEDEPNEISGVNRRALRLTFRYRTAIRG